MASTAAYVYCLVSAQKRPSLARVPRGLPGATVPAALEVSPGLWVVMADAPLAVYGEEPLTASLRDLDWVSAVAVAHESVVEHFSRIRGATTVPMKLFTMFSSRDRALADVRGRRRELAGVIKRIAGAEEWGVRVALEPNAPGPVKPAGGGSGAAFLAAKKQARDTARETVRLAAGAADDCFDALRHLARASTRRDDAPAGATTPPLLEAAFLVPHAGRMKFRAAARLAAAACRRRGASMTLTGPWPPYSFIQAPGAE